MHDFSHVLCRSRMAQLAETHFPAGARAARYVVGNSEIRRIGKQSEKQRFFELGGNAEVFMSPDLHVVRPEVSQEVGHGLVFSATTSEDQSVDLAYRLDKTQIGFDDR